MLVVSPAEVMAALLVKKSMATRPASNGSWPVTTSSMPADTPDNRISVYNTDAAPDGKLMKTGETLMRPEVQIRVRSVPASGGYKKLVEIANMISPLQSEQVTADDGTKVSIVAASIVSGPAHMGQEEKNQRQHHTLNVRLVLSQGAA